MKNSGLNPVMNNTRWEELRKAMHSLGSLHPQWRTKDVETGVLSHWDGEWFYHFRGGGYETIEWVEIGIDSPEQEAAVLSAIRTIHLPGERTSEGYRVWGYSKPGQHVKYIE